MADISVNTSEITSFHTSCPAQKVEYFVFKVSLHESQKQRSTAFVYIEL